MDKRLIKIVVPSVTCGIILYILFEAFLEWTYTNLQIQQTELERNNMHIPDETFPTTNTNLQNQKTELERKNMHIPDETFNTTYANLQYQKTELERKNTHIPDETFPTTMNVSVSCESREPRFLNETRPVVALASFAGSGNTWARQILESVTGIHTGSIYADFYKGSQRCHADGGVFIVKTHFANATAYRPNDRRRPCNMTKDFTRAIVIVRNPYDAMIANFNRVNGGKIEFARKQQFFSDDWKNFVWRTSIRWKEHLLFWLTKFHNPMHILIYEELKANTVKETYKVLKFLDFPVNFKALNCLNEDRGQEKYYRARKPSWLTKDNLYTPEMRAIVNSRIRDVYQNMEPTNISKTIENYLLK